MFSTSGELGGGWVSEASRIARRRSARLRSTGISTASISGPSAGGAGFSTGSSAATTAGGASGSGVSSDVTGSEIGASAWSTSALDTSTLDTSTLGADVGSGAVSATGGGSAAESWCAAGSRVVAGTSLTGVGRELHLGLHGRPERARRDRGPERKAWRRPRSTRGSRCGCRSGGRDHGPDREAGVLPAGAESVLVAGIVHGHVQGVPLVADVADVDGDEAEAVGDLARDQVEQLAGELDVEEGHPRDAELVERIWVSWVSLISPRSTRRVPQAAPVGALRRQHLVEGVGRDQPGVDEELAETQTR